MTTFNANQLQSFILELSDREIYNDVRSECDITAILDIRPDATPELFEQFTIQGGPEGEIAYGETVYNTVTAPTDYVEIVWLSIVSYSASPVTQFGWPQEVCEALGGDWIDGIPSICHLPSSLAPIRITITGRTATSCTVKIENRSDYAIRCIYFVSYLALSPERRYIKLRSIDETSIRKYGRRAMDLRWPLGQHPVTMQSMIDTYCTRYSEPVCIASMTLEGEIDAKITQILTLQIDDKPQIIHPGLEMDKEFFINSLTVSYDREGSGILTGTFDLEQVRTMEESTIFTWDVSEWDDGDVWG